jgi:hypothetical protein
MLKQENTTPAEITKTKAEWLLARKKTAFARRARERIEEDACRKLRKLARKPLAVRAKHPTASDGDYPSDRRATILRVSGSVVVIVWQDWGLSRSQSEGRTETWRAMELVEAEPATRTGNPNP